MENLDGPESFVMDRRIVLDLDLYPSRRNWLFCHELGHIILGHQKKPINREIEREADIFASELMLPSAEFRRDMNEMDIPSLKEKYDHASWEVICRRWADERPAVLTIYDNMQLTSRSAPEKLNFPPKPSSVEVEFIMECYNQQRHISRNVDGEIELCLQAFFVDIGSEYERVLLIAELLSVDY